MKQKLKQILKPLYYFRLFVVLLSTLSIIVSLVQPFLIGKLIDTITAKTIDTTRLQVLGLIIIVIVILYFFLNWLQNFMWFKMIYKGATIIRKFTFSSLLSNKYEFFSKYSSGEIVSRVINDSHFLAEQYLVAMPILLINFITIAIVFAFLFYMNILVSILVLLLCVVYFLFFNKLNKNLKDNTKLEREKYSSVISNTQQIYDGITTVKIYNKEQYFCNKFNEKVTSHCNYLVKLQNWKSLSQSLVGAILNFMPVIAILTSAYLIIKGEISVGVLVSFYAYLPRLQEPIQNLTDYNIMKQQAKVLEERIAELVPEDKAETIVDNKIDSIKNINIDKVNFSYDESKKIIENLSFELKAGDRLAIIGESGVGKSTLLKLLLNQLKCQSGNIKINNILLDEISKKEYLNALAVLPQDIFIFDDSIKENICLGENYCEDDIENILKLIKLTTNLDINGLSGGEIQRVGLARAMIKNCDLLILDEPTAALDIDTERTIVANIDRYLEKSDKILIVVSHREEILKICNKRLKLLDDGKYILTEHKENVI